MSDWKVIVPAAVTNMVLNPSAEGTGNYAALPGTGAIAVITSVQRYGLSSYSITTAADNDGASFTLSALSNAIHYVTLRLYAGSVFGGGASWDWSLDNATYTAPTLLRVDGDWYLYGLQFPAVQANGSTLLYIRQDGAGACSWQIDGIQIEADTTYTTYCDGDQPGCEWSTIAHGSTSTRSAVSRAGGAIYDFHDDYHMGIREHIGAGMLPHILSLDSYAILPGAELNAIKQAARPFTLIGVAKGYGADCDLHQTRQDLIGILAHDAYPKDGNGWQPVRLRYRGADVEKEIAAHYEGGLEATIRLENRIHEIVPIRFIAPDPLWYGIGEASHELDVQDSIAVTRYVVGRLRSTGQWDDLGPPAAPAAANAVYAVAISQEKHLFIGGDFTQFGGDADANRICEWDRSAWSWPAGEGVDDGIVYALLFGSDDTLYVGGSFTAVSGAMGNTDGIAAWDYGTDTWSALGTGVTNAGESVNTLAVDKDGNIYAGGNFGNGMGGVANTARVAYWDGAWNAMGTGVDNNTVRALAAGLDGTIYVGGDFTTVDTGSAYVRIAKWDATNGWASMGDANNTVYEIAVDPNDGTVYVCGAFTQIGGQSISYVAKWNGTTYEAMGTLNAAAYWITVGPDGMVYASGSFTSADGVGVNNLAKWNGSSWVGLDLYLPANADPLGIACGNVDPVITSNYDIFVGHQQSAAATCAGSQAATNAGTAPARPKIIIDAPAAATARVAQVRNETTGKELSIEYTLQPGERLTIDLAPPDLSVISSYYGPRNDAILAGSDIGNFMLIPGSNQVTAFASTTNADIYLLWRNSYKSFD